MSNRIYFPPRIENGTPNDIFQQAHGNKFTFVRKRLATGAIITTPNIAVFADGACPDNGKPNARAGMGVYFGLGSRLNFHEELITGRPTSQRAEIHAAILALRRVQDLIDCGELSQTQTIVLVLDSQYVVRGMTSWVETWRKNGWMTVDGESVMNKVDFQELDELIDELENVNGVYVKLWRVDRRYNAGADAEAKKAIRYQVAFMGAPFVR
jgi:ribonuclease HI